MAHFLEPKEAIMVKQLQ